MKKFIICVCAVFLCMWVSGCAVKLATGIGSSMGDSLQESAEKGALSAEVIAEAWPYASGMIKRAQVHGLDLTEKVNTTIENLDALSAKDWSEVTLEEKGDIILSICIVDAAAIKEGWEKYGVSISKFIGL